MKGKSQELELRQRIVGSFLKTAREKAGLTQFQVASRLRYSTAQFVSNWERGVSLPPLDALRRLTDILRISPKALVETLCHYQDELLRLRKREILKCFNLG